MFLKNQTLPLKPWVFEIEDQANAKLGNTQVVQHLATLVISNTINDFRIRQYRVESNQIRIEQTHRYLLVQNLKLPLLRTGNSSEPKFNHQGILIALFVQTIAEFIDHFERAADDLVGFFL